MTPSTADPQSSLRGKRVLVLASGMSMLDEVLSGLVDHGAQVVLLGDAEVVRAGVERVTLDLSAADAAARSIDDAIARLGPPDLVLLSIVPVQAAQIAPITELREEEWQAGAVDGLRATIWVLQALGPHLKPNGGAIVTIAPSLSLVGAPDLIALTTLLEGQRGLMKSVARQWGDRGVSLNWIAAAPRALSSVFDAAKLATKPDMVTVARGRPTDPRTEIVPLLGFLASPAGRVLTGATLTLDGGEWMTP